MGVWLYLVFHNLKAIDEKSTIRICNQVVRNRDPDPYQNVTDHEH